MSDVISEVVLGLFWLMLPGPGRQPLGQSVSLKFSLETRLKSESFHVSYHNWLLAFHVSYHNWKHGK